VSAWNLGFLLGGVVVLVVAALLIALLVVARTIAGLASTALAVAGDIEKATTPIWGIGTANETVQKIAATVQSIEGRVAAVAEVLERGGAR
jgi:hypothetical protein